MAHLTANAAIFSPSVARQAASTAKDWNYVDGWLASHFRGRAPPPFERNSDTLRALLALAAFNEGADDERALLARLDAQALAELRSSSVLDSNRGGEGGEEGDMLDTSRDAILTALEAELSHDGRTALDAMAAAAVELGVSADPRPDPDLATLLGARMVELQGRVFELEQAAARVGVLQRHVASESAQADALLRDLELGGGSLFHDSEHDFGRGEGGGKGENSGTAATGGTGVNIGGERFFGYRPPHNLAKQNLEAQRRIKAITTQLPELRDRAAAQESSVSASIGSAFPPEPSIDQVRREEDEYLRLLAVKKSLDTQIRSFRGLPPDADMARRELENLREELRSITQRRDAVFEGLVERETPRKGR